MNHAKWIILSDAAGRSNESFTQSSHKVAAAAGHGMSHTRTPGDGSVALNWHDAPAATGFIELHRDYWPSYEYF